MTNPEYLAKVLDATYEALERPRIDPDTAHACGYNAGVQAERDRVRAEVEKMRDAAKLAGLNKGIVLAERDAAWDHVAAHNRTLVFLDLETPQTFDTPDAAVQAFNDQTADAVDYELEDRREHERMETGPLFDDSPIAREEDDDDATPA